VIAFVYLSELDRVKNKASEGGYCLFVQKHGKLTSWSFGASHDSQSRLFVKAVRLLKTSVALAACSNGKPPRCLPPR
jgi:hypothetical protein